QSPTPPQIDLVDLPEVLAAASKLYPSLEDWQGITFVEADFRVISLAKRYGLIVLSNFLHVYGENEAEELLCKAASLLQEGGLLLIHDYFPDRQVPSLAKGALYDLAMMLNTYNGRCHTSSTLRRWLQKCSLPKGQMLDLSTDSSLLITVRGTPRVSDIILSALTAARPFAATAKTFRHGNPP
ncbi:MAG: methyltransferase, partial [Desulfobulbaceae bacterium]|nr:methyltransferase [Desulfobulbaceae bacterium]